MEYRYWQIESLLSQAIDLLDRCLIRRNVVVEFEIKHFFQQQQIDKDRVSLDAEDLKKTGLYYQLRQEISHENIKEASKNKQAANEVLNMTQQIYDGAKTHEERQVQHVAIHEARLSTNHWNTQDIIAHKNKTMVETENIVQEQAVRALRAEYDNKKNKFESPDGFLNFNNQAKIYYHLLLSDFRDALERLRASEVGMQRYYGYEMRLPADGSLELSLESYIEAAYKAFRWLQAFSHKDQATCKVISVRHFVGEEDWQRETNNILGGRELNFNFWITDSLFDLSHVRLRGISAYIVGEIPIAWTGVVTLPATANVKYLSGKSEPLNQSEIPSCKLGRIDSKFSHRIPDVYGSVSLSNASPISADKTTESSWKLTLNVPELRYFDSKLKINDVQLELLFMGQPVR
ncbi:MAG: hypothetical protein V9E86_04340 [Nitrosomonas sp.]